MRSIIAILLPVLIGAVVYAALAVGATPEGWEESSTLMLPAILIGIMLVALVFLPLWSVLPGLVLVVSGLAARRRRVQRGQEPPPDSA